MQTYSYTPLAKQTIRLLSLHDSSSSTFSGTLKTFSLADAPEYYCLSYTWGSEAENVAIHIDGQILYVRPSLVEMLRELQKLEAEDSASEIKAKWVWIDRICINQKDVDERSEQVRCMGIIYTQSVRTLIWAGPDLDGCSAAWSLIEQIYTICRSNNAQARYLGDIPFQLYSDQKHKDYHLPQWDDAIWEHLRQLFELPWFTRTWIIQEVALSSKDPVILHGRHRYSWDKLGWAASWLRRNGYLRLKQIPDQLQNCDTISNIRRCRNHWRLDALLGTSSVKFKSTDQRDKIYGLLGLAAETQNTRNIPDALMPDYNLEVWEVYTKVTLYFLRQYGTLPTLALASGIWGNRYRAQRKHQYKLLPSWVPDWGDACVSNSEHTKGLSWLAYKTDGEATTYGFSKYYNASAGLTANVLDSPDPSVLRVKGLIAGTVVSVVPYEETSPAAEQESILRAWKTAVQRLSTTSVMDCITAFIISSVSEQYGLVGRSREQIHKDGAAYLLGILKNDSAPQTDNGHVVEALTTTSIDGNPASYLALARNVCHNRSFIITSNGCVGISHLGTEVGDVVAVIFGGGVPYVIRENDNSFLFVGESYIYGLMSGEAVQNWREGRLKEEVLEFH